MTRRILDIENDITNVRELIDLLGKMHRGSEVTYVSTASGADIRLELEEETLSDGSLVYNIIIKDSPFPKSRP